MKNFARLSFFAVIAVVFVIVASLTVTPVSAASKVPTVYIAENAQGTGDGSSPANAMGSVEIIAPSVPNATTNYEKYCGGKYYQNSALYRAASKLSTTGGKIVLVGDISIDFTKTAAGAVNADGTYTARQNYRDFEMPSHGNYEIIITNEEHNGRLILTEGARFILGGKTVFTDIDIVTHDGTATEDGAKINYAICCNNYPATFGEGITVTAYSGNLNTSNITKITESASSASEFVSIYGGKRYGDGSGTVDITVESGTWNRVCGGNEGNSGNIQYADIAIDIKGGKFLSAVSGGGNLTYTALPIFGDVNISIGGGEFYNSIYALSSSPFGYAGNTAYIKVTGGTFYNSAKLKSAYGTGAGNVPLTVDFSACELSDTVINSIITPLSSDVKIIYPARWVTSASIAHASDIAFLNEEYGNGLTFNVTYKNGKTGVIAYDPEDPAFKVGLDTTSKGTKQLEWTVGSASGVKTVEVIGVPSPEFLGAQVGVQEDKLGKLRLVAKTSLDFTSGVTVDEKGSVPYGFILFINTSVTDKMDIDVTKVKGYIDLKAEHFRSDCDKDGIYNNQSLRTFSAELNDISVKDYGSNISIAAYVKFTYNGKEYVRYSQPDLKSVCGVADTAINSPDEPKEFKDFIQTNIIDKYKSYQASITNVVDSAAIDEMRQQVVDAYTAMATYQWTPSETFTLVTGTGTSAKTNTYYAGTVYKGIPYVNNSKATLSEFTANIKTVSGTSGSTNIYIGPIRGIYDIFGTPVYNTEGVVTSVSGGVLSSTKYLAALQSQKVLTDYVDQKMLTISTFFPATDFSAIYNAWNVVGTNEVWPVGIQGALPSAGYGTVAVGGYSYSGNDTKTICTTNGTTAMYKAYAACKPGDVLVNYSSSGRSLYMVTGASNGSAANSTLRVSYNTDTLANNSNFVLNKTFSLQSLYNSGFIPVTIPELVNGLKTPTTAILVGFDVDKTFENCKVQGTIESNRTIVSATVKIGVGDKYIYDKTLYYTTIDPDMNRVDLKEFDVSSVYGHMAAGETYELTVIANIAGESQPTVLVKEAYTKPENDLDKYSKVFTDANTPILKLPDNKAQSAIDSMWAQFEDYNWTPSHSFKYIDADPNSDAFSPSSIYLAGTNYKGILYSNMRATSAEFNKTLVTVGNNKVVKIDTTLSKDSQGRYQVDWSKIMGNHCSASMFHAFQSSSRVSAAYGSRMNPAMKSILLDDIYARFAKSYLGHTGSFTKAYGSYAMYEEYATWQKGDYMYNSTDGGGHTRMVSEVYVSRNAATGKIDPDRSYVLFCEQTDTLISDRIDTNGYYLMVGTAESGTTFMQFVKKANWASAVKPANYKRYTKFSDYYNDYGYDTTFWMNVKYTFRDLGGSTYNAMGVRPLDYITNVSEKMYVGINHQPTLEQFRSPSAASPTVIETNYPLVSAFVRITNVNTGAVTEVAGVRAQTNLYRYKLETLGTSLNTKLNSMAKGTYKIEVIAELAVGEIPVLTYNYTK